MTFNPSKLQDSSPDTTPAPEVPLRTVVLASGQGTLLQALIDELDPAAVSIVAVGADRECPAVDRAHSAGVEGFVVPFDGADRDGWNESLAAQVAAYQPDLVVSAGFMRILGPGFLRRFPHRVINTHPALLPAFPGAHAVGDALAYGVKVTGSTIHVVDEGVDTGPILAQQPVDVAVDDDEATLHERIKTVERKLLVQVLTEVSRRGIHVDGRKATIQ